MGLVHTGIRSKLGVEKVRKTTMVGMDIKCAHREAGLLPTRGRRNFISETAAGTQALNHATSENDITDFNQLSKSLIAGAVSANFDKDIGDGYDSDLDSEDPDRPLTITIPPSNSAIPSLHATQAKKTCIPLEILFDYPTGTDLPSEGMNLFWSGGIENLEKEMETYELLISSDENSDGIQFENPTTLVDLDII